MELERPAKVPHDRGLEDHETLLADAIRTQANRGHIVRVWIKATACCWGGDARRREGEDSNKPERDWEGVSHHYCHGVTQSSYSASPSVYVGPGRLVGDTLPFLPSIHPSISL